MSSAPSTPPAPPVDIPSKLGGSTTAELDDFRAPSPQSSPRTPQDPFTTESPTRSPKTPVPGTSFAVPGTSSLTPPPFTLPGPARPVQLAPLHGQDFRIPRTIVPELAPVPPKRTLKVLPLSVTKHIQRTVHRRETSAARRKYRKANKPWTCTACKKICADPASKEAHQKTRQHWLNTKAQIKLCVPCDFSTNSPEDFARHINGKRHKKRVAYKINN